MIQYPCKEDHHETNVDQCFWCKENKQCDIYASMLDEEENVKNKWEAS